MKKTSLFGVWRSAFGVETFQSLKSGVWSLGSKTKSLCSPRLSDSRLQTRIAIRHQTMYFSLTPNAERRTPNAVRIILLTLLFTCTIAALGAADASTTNTPPATPTSTTSITDLTDASGRDPSVTPLLPTPISAPIASTNIGGLTLSVSNPNNKQGMSNAVSLLLLITVLSIAPAFMMMMTSFTRIIIVLGFVRRALGTQSLPPNQVMVGLALFLTLFIMTPTFNRVNKEAIQPYLADQITQEQGLENAKNAVRDFMIKQTRKNDLALFIRLAKEERPKTIADVSFTTLIPAFITSELKTAFQMGFVIFLPFLVIDMVISAILMALGMMMLPPVTISMPFKILLFVLVDGWTLLMQSLVASFGT